MLLPANGRMARQIEQLFVQAVLRRRFDLGSHARRQDAYRRFSAKISQRVYRLAHSGLKRTLRTRLTIIQFSICCNLGWPKACFAFRSNQVALSARAHLPSWTGARQEVGIGL